ncbi:tol-pal system protein YbgF [bacterium]|nr:MAG: tol-pal system protein YbgF [bacterium]
MNRLKLFALIAALSLASGCASFVEKEEHDRLSTKVDALRQSAEESKTKQDELGNKFMLLYEKMEAARVKMESMNPAKAEPPDGLKVIKLADGATAGEQAKKAEPAQIKEEKEVKEVKEEKAALPPPQNVIKAEVGDKQEKAEVAPEAEPQSKKKPAPPVTPDTLYSRGQDLFMAGKYAEARKVFGELARKFAVSDLADNALYWIGESYYTEKDFVKAISKFNEAVNKYPSGNKAPDSLLKVGFAYIEMNNTEKAKEALLAVVRRYPDSEAAVTAEKALGKLSSSFGK